MKTLYRRGFLAGAAALTAAEMLHAADGFTFLHLTDTHIQPELHASSGCRMCFENASRLRADFAIMGGDLVFDAAEQRSDRAKLLYDLYAETMKRLEMPAHAVIGNHDVFGVAAKGAVSSDDPGFGKKMFEDRIGPRYRSFDHKGWHFVLLDSIELTTDSGFLGPIRGGVDADQLAWLKQDLAKLAPRTPIVVTTHIPLVTGAAGILDGAGRYTSLAVRNAREVLDVLWQYNVKMVLQGHTHITERLTYNGCEFITSGAVSGNWWRGKRLFDWEGYGVVRIQGNEARWSYRTYGFKADAA
jgi:3',5'-cyclic-AMP phosphodiesterase